MTTTMRILVGMRDEPRADDLRGVAVGYVDGELVEVIDFTTLLDAEIDAIEQRLVQLAADMRAGRRSAIQ